MPEQSKLARSIHQGEAQDADSKKYLKLGKKITDVVLHKITGLTTEDPEYWGLREMLTPEMCDVANKMKLRKFYNLDELIKMNKEIEPAHLVKLLDEMSVIGILEYGYGERYGKDGPLYDFDVRTMSEEEKIKHREWRVCFFVPGSAELFNSSLDRIEKNPAVTNFFERMTFIPLAGITQMIPEGGDGVGMHVIPVEKEVQMNNEAIDVEKIS